MSAAERAESVVLRPAVPEAHSSPGGPALYIGTSGWNYASWRGTFYAGCAKPQWLAFCARQFTAIEVNATFYRLQSRDTFRRWRRETPPAFRFAIKANRFLTHNLKLNRPLEPVRLERERAAGLGDKLAAVVWQLPRTLQRSLPRLEGFVRALSHWRSTRHVIEFRHPSWFDASVAACLRAHRVAVCQSDAADWPLWDEVTTDLVYLRLHGHHVTYVSAYSEAELVFACRAHRPLDRRRTDGPRVFRQRRGRSCATRCVTTDRADAPAARQGTGLAPAWSGSNFNWRSAMIEGKRVAILVAEGFEQAEMVEPRKALQQAGAETTLVSPARDEVQGWHHYDKGDRFQVDVTLEDAQPDDYDALLLPGGVANPDQLRTNPKAVSFVKRFVESGKPVGVICHGPWTLIEAGVVKGRTLTSWPSLRTDLVNAGAKWVDQEVVADRGLVSSRKPADIPAFNRKLIEEIGEAQHAH